MALITAQEVISNALTNANFDTHLVKDTFIEIAELNFIKPALGERLYEDVVEEVAAYSSGLNIECTLTSGQKTITPNTPIPASSSATTAVHDFVKGNDVPIYEDDNTSGGDTNCCRGLTKITSITKNGSNEITSFEVSSTIQTSNSTAMISINKPNITLWRDYIKKYLAFCVKFEMMPDMSYNTTSQGVVENVGEFSMPVDATKLNFLRNETFKKSDTYLRKMTDFLNENDEAYPNWCNMNEGGVSKKNGIILY